MHVILWGKPVVHAQVSWILFSLTWWPRSVWAFCQLLGWGFPDSSIGKESTSNSWVRKIRWRRGRLHTPVFSGFPCGSTGKESTCNAGDLGSIPGLGRSPREGNGCPLQYPGLENSMDCIPFVVAGSRTQLSDFHSLQVG